LAWIAAPHHAGCGNCKFTGILHLAPNCRIEPGARWCGGGPEADFQHHDPAVQTLHPHAVLLLGLIDLALLVAAAIWRGDDGAAAGLDVGEMDARLWPIAGFSAMMLTGWRGGGYGPNACARSALPWPGCWWRSRWRDRAGADRFRHRDINFWRSTCSTR